MLPVLFLLLCFVVEIGNLWLARAELETALESAALAAAKEWGDAGSSSNTSTPRQVAQAFAAANTVRGQPISLVLNYNAAGVPNRNAALTGDGAQLVFGAITSTSPTVVFNASVAPGCGGGTTASTSKVLLDATSDIHAVSHEVIRRLRAAMAAPSTSYQPHLDDDEWAEPPALGGWAEVKSAR